MPEMRFSGKGGGFSGEHKQSLVTDTVKITQLADTDYVDIPMYIPDGRTLYVWLWGVRTDTQTTPAGLTAQLHDHELDVIIDSANTEFEIGNPLTSLEGPADASLRVYNDTGNQLNAGGYFSATIE